jgi:hypothetical protein
VRLRPGRVFRAAGQANRACELGPGLSNAAAAKRFLTSAGGGAGCRAAGPSHRMISRSLRGGSTQGQTDRTPTVVSSCRDRVSESVFLRRPVRLHREFGFENAGGVSNSGCMKGEIFDVCCYPTLGKRRNPSRPSVPQSCRRARIRSDGVRAARRLGCTKGAMTTFTAPAYWKFDSGESGANRSYVAGESLRRRRSRSRTGSSNPFPSSSEPANFRSLPTSSRKARCTECLSSLVPVAPLIGNGRRPARVDCGLHALAGSAMR